MKIREVYGLILSEFGLNEFTAKGLEKKLKIDNVALPLHRLCVAGYLVRVSRGVYRATHPVVLALEWAGFRWREKIVQKIYLPILEHIVVGLIQNFWTRVISIVLFGSVAAGKARPESDVDLLIVIEDLPENYSERLKIFRKATEGIEEITLDLWRKYRIYPLVSPVILTPEEAEKTQPFYLDMIETSVIILDKNGFMKRKLEDLRGRLSQLGARRIVLPDGTWFWELKPSIKPGEVIDL